MKKKLLISLVLVCLLCITGCGNNDGIKVNTDDNIVANAYMSFDNSELIVTMKNNNSYNIGSFHVNATYYDELGNKLGEDSEACFDFKNNSEYVSNLYISTSTVPKKIEVTVTVEKDLIDTNNDLYYNEQVSSSYKVNDDQLNVDIKNNSDKQLEITGSVVFYKGTIPIAQEEIRRNLQTKETNSDSIYIPEEYNEKLGEQSLLKYDSIKVFINSAKEW